MHLGPSKLDNIKVSNAFSKKKGFTLIEVMVAMVVILVIFAGGFGALSYGNKLIETARDETRASQVLQSEFTDAYSSRYTVKRKIATRSATEKRVTMAVTWMDNRGTSHTREYITLIAKDGLYDYYYRSF